MTGVIIGAITAGVAIVIGVVIVQAVLDGQTTTTWSAGTIAIVFLLPLILGAAGVMGILKLMGRV